MVTQIYAGNGIVATPEHTGVISLASTSVVPGSYTTADITVDSTGRIVAASDGAAPPLPPALTSIAALTTTYNNFGLLLAHFGFIFKNKKNICITKCRDYCNLDTMNRPVVSIKPAYIRDR